MKDSLADIQFTRSSTSVLIKWSIQRKRLVCSICYFGNFVINFDYNL